MSEEQEFKYSSEAAAPRRKLAEKGRSAATDVEGGTAQSALFIPCGARNQQQLPCIPLKLPTPLQVVISTSRDETLFSS